MTWLRLLAPLVAVAVVLAIPSVSAQEADDAPELLILDASGSMNATNDNGVRLIDGAQQALARLVEVLARDALHPLLPGARA